MILSKLKLKNGKRKFNYLKSNFKGLKNLQVPLHNNLTMKKPIYKWKINKKKIIPIQDSNFLPNHNTTIVNKKICLINNFTNNKINLNKTTTFTIMVLSNLSITPLLLHSKHLILFLNRNYKISTHLIN